MDMTEKRLNKRISNDEQPSPVAIDRHGLGAVIVAVLVTVSMVAVGGLAGPVAADSTAQSGPTEGALTVVATPGEAGAENKVAFGFNASNVSDQRSVLNIDLNFSEASGVTTTEISEDQVSIQGQDTGNPSPDSTSSPGPGVLRVTSSDTFTLANEGGMLWVNVTGVEVPNEGTFDAGVEFRDDEENAVIAFGDAQYTIGGGSQGPASFDVDIAGTNSPVTEGDSLSVEASVENTGSENGTQTISLDAGALGSDDASIELGGGESTTTTLTVETTEGDAGSYTATVSSEDDSASTDVTVQAAATTGSLNVTASPGESGVENQVTFAFNASEITDQRSIEDILLDFSEASGVDTAAISEDDVTIEGESTGNPSVDATSEEAPGVVRVVSSDTFTLAGEGGVIEVTVVGVTVPETGTFDAGIEFRDSEEDAVVATGSDQYTIEAGGPEPIEGGDPPQDTDDDGQYEDTNGDGEFTISDVQLLFENRNADVVTENADFFDFDDDGEITLSDIQALYEQLLGN